MSAPLRRGLALFLAAQPIFWMSSATYAQVLQDPTVYGGTPATAPGGLGGAGAGPGDYGAGAGGYGSAPGGYGGTPGTYGGAPGGLGSVPGGYGPGATGYGGPGYGGAPMPDTAGGAMGARELELLRSERTGTGANAPATTPIDEPIDPDRYLCGPGDVLELNFWGVQNFRMRLTVDVEGRAFVPKVGYFALQGKTLTQARQLLQTSVASLYPRLSFGLAVAEPRVFLVQVADDVVRPGAYTAHATDRVAAIVTKAGGFGPKASRRRVEIRRRDGTVLTADLLLYALTGDVKFNPYLLDGDAVRVPFEELAAGIGGAVNRPGRYELVKTRDLAELVELAGGLSPTATQLLPVTVVRRGAGDREDLRRFDFSAGKLPAVQIEPEDIVRIPATTELQQSVLVIGAIAGATRVEAAPLRGAETGAAAGRSTAPEEATATRRLDYVKGDTVRTLVERAGGVGPLADLGGAYILRGGKAVPVDLQALIMLRDLGADRAIELGDTLVIPFKRRNVLVEGSVFAPGSYPFNPAFGVEQYLALAGGRSRNALPIDEVKVVTPNGETMDYRPDLKVEPGSSLVVPERNFSRSELVQILISAAGVILSGVAVVIVARK